MAGSTGLLAVRGNLDEALQILRTLDDDDEIAADRLAGLLADRRERAKADALRRFGFNPDGSIATGPDG